MSKGKPRLAITRGDEDLLRIIPSAFEDEKLDLVIDPLESDWLAFCYPPMQINPIFSYEDQDATSAITYHHGTSNKDVVVHIKRREKLAGQERYSTLPLGDGRANSTWGLYGRDVRGFIHHG